MHDARCRNRNQSFERTLSLEARGRRSTAKRGLRADSWPPAFYLGQSSPFVARQRHGGGRDAKEIANNDEQIRQEHWCRHLRTLHTQDVEVQLEEEHDFYGSTVTTSESDFFSTILRRSLRQ